MTTDQIRELYNARPFKPFRVHLADGSSVPIKSPEFMGMTPGGRVMFVSKGDDAGQIIDLLLVTKVSIGREAQRRRRGQHGRE
jgi:hypothetical protein